jgi:hypothetical protein
MPFTMAALKQKQGGLSTGKWAEMTLEISRQDV